MKRSPLKRKTAINRSSIKLGVNKRANPIARKGKTKHARRERSPAFMGWTARQSCMVRSYFGRLYEHATKGRLTPERVADLACEGPIQVDHAGNRFTDGDGTRAFDRTCIPLCRKHHEQRTNAGGTRGQAGIFSGFTAEMVRTWSDKAIEIHQSAARAAGVAVPSC